MLLSTLPELNVIYFGNFRNNFVYIQNCLMWYIIKALSNIECIIHIPHCFNFIFRLYVYKAKIKLNNLISLYMSLILRGVSLNLNIISIKLFDPEIFKHINAILLFMSEVLYLFCEKKNFESFLENYNPLLYKARD